jgi:hypothetical protein
MLPEAYRRRIIVTGGDVLPTFLLDGFVAGLWWAEAAADGSPRIVFEPFGALTSADRTALEAEAGRVVRVIGGREPEVYRRYRRSGRRR